MKIKYLNCIGKKINNLAKKIMPYFSYMILQSVSQIKAFLNPTEKLLFNMFNATGCGS